jgi:hypothetical protein
MALFDSAAQWTGAMRGPAFFAYANNYLIDVKVGIIMDVEATSLRAASSSHAAASITSWEIPSSVNVPSIGTEPDPAAPNILRI